MIAKCEHDDCFTCPYPDCIADVAPKPTKKEIDERKEKRKKYLHEYYLKRKEAKKKCT